MLTQLLTMTTTHKFQSQVLTSVDPKSCSLRELLSKILTKFRELDLDITLMSKETTLKTSLRRLKNASKDKTGPYISTFFELGNLNNL